MASKKNRDLFINVIQWRADSLETSDDMIEALRVAHAMATGMLGEDMDYLEASPVRMTTSFPMVTVSSDKGYDQEEAIRKAIARDLPVPARAPRRHLGLVGHERPPDPDDYYGHTLSIGIFVSDTDPDDYDTGGIEGSSPPSPVRDIERWRELALGFAGERGMDRSIASSMKRFARELDFALDWRLDEPSGVVAVHNVRSLYR